LLDPAEALRIGLSTRAYAHLLRLAGFRPIMPRALGKGEAGPPAPVVWRWRAPRARWPGAQAAIRAALCGAGRAGGLR
jgi:ATP-dependent RNA helicase SUPV3L1/SUV3